jgi:hypothetical protein
MVFCLSAAFASQAMAQSNSTDSSVFGIPLAVPITIPECAKDKDRYEVLLKNVCYQRWTVYTYGKKYDSKNPAPTLGNGESLMISFPYSEKPSIMKGFEMMATVLDGKIEGVGFNTYGISSDDEALEKLKAKYGEPKSLIKNKVQNRMGASYDAFVAFWEFPDLYVTFESVATSLDSGLVNISTKKGKEYRDAALKELLKDKRPL